MKQIIFRQALAALLFLLILSGCADTRRLYSNNPPIIARSADEQVIAWVEQVKPEGMALMNREEPKVKIVINGESGPGVYDSISSVLLSDDGSRIAFIGSEEGKSRLILDGEEYGPPFEEMNPTTMTFSSDASRFAYAAFFDGQWHAVIDGEAGVLEEYSFVDSFIFSPDGRSLAYRVHRGNEQAVVLNGTPGPLYNKAEHLVFSPDSGRFAYTAGNEEGEFVIVDGEPGTVWEEAGLPVFSFDGSSIAYGVKSAGLSSVVKDGALYSREYPMEMMISSIVYGPEDHRIAFTAHTEKGWVAVIDGVEGPEFIDIIHDSLVLSPDGNGYAYMAADGNGWFVMKDGVSHQPWDRIVISDSPYSADGKRFVYAGQVNNKWHIIRNAIPGPSLVFDELKTSGGPEISSDGNTLFFSARKGDEWHVVVNDIEGPGYSRVYEPVFDSSSVVYLAETAPDGRLVRSSHKGEEITQKGLALLPEVPYSEEECVPCKVERRQETLKKLKDS